MNGNITFAYLSDELSDYLNDALSRVATNTFRTHINLSNFTEVDSYTISLEGSVDLGSKYKRLMTTGGGGSAGVSITIKTTNELKNKVREQNDFIQGALFTILEKRSGITAWSDGKEISFGEIMNKSGITIAASFSQRARKVGSELGVEHYNKTFINQKSKVWQTF